MRNMLSSCQHLTIVDLCCFDTSNVTMNNIFSYCQFLKSLIISSFNSNKVKDMSFMFYDCSSLQTLDISSFNMKNDIDKSNMFDDCSKLRNKKLK